MNYNPLSISRRGKAQHKGPEKRYQEKVARLLLEMKCRVEKLHGSAYQAGLPDLLVLTPSGKLQLIEIKWAERDPHRIGELFLMLHGRQRSLIPLWARAGAPIFILCGCRSGNHYAVHAGVKDLERMLPHEYKTLDTTLEEIIHGRC